MDGAEAGHRYQAIGANVNIERQWVGRRGDREEAFGVSLRWTVSSADLGGSSKYSNENFEDWSGEGFHVNSNWTWVSRS